MDEIDWDQEASEQTEYITIKDEAMELDPEDEMYEGYYVLEVEEEGEEEEIKFNPQEEYCEETLEKDDIETQASLNEEDILNVDIKKESDVEDDHITFDDERTKDSTRTDLFQQPFVLKFLKNHVQAKKQKEHDSLLLDNEFESFVDPKCVCRLCMKTEQNIFFRLFYINNKITPIAKKLAFLMGKEKVDEDLLPQQICLECSELVSSCYSSVKHFSEAYHVLSEVVAEVKKKTHVFHKPGSTSSMQLKIYDKCYEFCRSLDLNTNDKSNKKQKLDMAANIKCYLCQQNFLPDQWKEHMAQEHDCHIEYKCSSCDNAFSTLSLLFKHACPNADVEDNEEYIANVADSDSNSIISISNTTYELKRDTPKEEGRKKRLLLQEHCNKIVESGTKDCQSCGYCARLFKSTTSEVIIKAHVVSHMNEIDYSGELDPLNIVLADHLKFVPCYVCAFCEMPKKSPSELRDHLSFYCTTFANQFKLKIRDRRRHGKTRGKSVSCKTCADKKLYSKKEYTRHMKENHPELVYKCPCCPCTFLSRCELTYHSKVIHLQPEKLLEVRAAKMKAKKVKHENKDGLLPSFLCEFCSRECKSRSGYQHHVLKMHLNTGQLDPKRSARSSSGKPKRVLVNTARLECPICKVKLHFKNGHEGLEFHIMKHNSPSGKVECCNREYNNYTKYKTHMSSHSRTWPCRSCGLQFNSSVLLQDHVSNAHSKCRNCSYVAKNLDEFIKHGEECSSGGGGVICTICNILFSSKRDRLYHRRQCHWDECKTSKNPTCDLPEPVLCCGKKFTKKANLKAHSAKHQDTRCRTCGDVLKSKLALQNHNATHHRQGVECSYCNKSFCNSDSLKYHTLKHTQGRVFKCPCGLAFYTEADVHKHQRTRKTPCVGTMIQQAPGMSEIIRADAAEDTEWTGL